MGQELKAYGKPKGSAMHAALPAQVATVLNVLRFVDALNALLRRRLVDGVKEALVGGETRLSASYDALMSWGDEALQARFSGATQYLKSAKKFGFLHYEGEAAVLAIGERRSRQREKQIREKRGQQRSWRRR